MAEFPAFPIWTDAYLADCGHLTDAERRRYKCLRGKGGSRELAIEVIMMEREERPTACLVNPFERG